MGGCTAGSRPSCFFWAAIWPKPLTACKCTAVVADAGSGPCYNTAVVADAGSGPCHGTAVVADSERMACQNTVCNMSHETRQSVATVPEYSVAKVLMRPDSVYLLE